MLIDTHCHLNLRDKFPDPEPVVAAAREEGVDRLVVVGIDEATSRHAVELAERFEGVFATVGWHPTSTANFQASWLEPIRELAGHPKVVAIGEIGLDYYWPDSPPADQERALLAQLDLAAELGKPVVYHCRDAYPALLSLLEARTQPGAQVMHCFGGHAEDARRAVALDLYFGVDGPVTYKNAAELRETLKTIPRDRLVLETDSPFLPPVPFRGKPNVPAFVPYIARGLGDTLGLSETEIAALTTANAERLFRLGSG
ncbi:MAG TPA: TatD family hydrolase [Fimbriimonadaceae bacterium]|nr:TatD family hydrolase [Fimbriimonadaceae bacterium]